MPAREAKVRSEESDKLIAYGEEIDLKNSEINDLNARIKELEGELQQAAGSAIPYTQITKELKYKYPSVSGLSLSRGSHMRMEGDSVAEVPVPNALIQSAEALTAEELAEITRWLRLRMSDSTVVANNIVENE